MVMQAYGLFKKDHEESGRIKPFADPLLYSGSLKYKIFEVNDTILGPHGAARTRRTLPRLPKNPTALLPKARINQFRQYHDVVSILDDFSLNNCFGHEQFMLLEDDFQLCENALIEHIPKILEWSEKNWKFWSVIRVGCK